MTGIASRFTNEASSLQRHATLFGKAPEFGPIDLRNELKNRVVSQELRTSQLPKELSTRIQSISEKLGGAKVSIRHVSRTDIKGAEQLMLRFKGGSLKGSRGQALTLKLPVPLSRGRGFFFKGATGQSPYVTPRYGIVEDGRIVSTINHEEWMLRRAEAELVPEVLGQKRMEQSALHKMRSAWEQEFYGRSSWVQRHHFTPGKESGYLTSRRHLLSLVKESGEALTDQELIGLIKESHLLVRPGKARSFRLFPLSPGTLAKDTFTMADPRSGYVVPEATSLGRRPLQYVRPQYSLSPRARAAMASRAGEFDWIFGKKVGGKEGSLLKTLFVSARHDPTLAKHGITSGGMSAISESARPFMERIEHIQFDISSGTVSREFAGLESFVGRTVPGGSVMGRSPSGELISAPGDIKIARALPFQDINKGRYISIEAEKTVDDIRLSKLFGSTKTLARGQTAETIRRIAGQVGVSVSDAGAFGAPEMITVMDDMRKNRGLFYEQLFSSLHEFTKQNISSGKASGKLASNFASQPAYIAKLAGDQAKMLEAFKIARGAKFTPEQMGLTFGAVQDVLGIAGDTPQALRENWTRYMMEASGKSPEFIDKALGTSVSRGFWKHKVGLSLPEAGWISKGVAAGMGQFFYGEPFAAGSGKRASFEPRTFELLGSGHMGKLGMEIREEFLGRLGAEYGGRTTAQDLLVSSLSSIHAAAEGRGSMVSTAIEASDVTEDMYKTGFNLRAGQQSVYVPPSDLVEALRPHHLGRDASGEARTIEKRLGYAYRGLVQDVGQAGTEAEMIDALRTARGEVGGATFGTAAGKLGILSGKMPATENLTITMPKNLAQASMDMQTVGVPRGSMDRMFRDLEGIHGVDEIAEMRSRYERHGKVAGLLGRRPDIDRYSNVPVWIQEVSGDLPEVVVPEKSLYTHAVPGQLEGEALEKFKREARFLQASGRQPSPIRMSPLVGLAGDFDADLASVSLVSPRLEAGLGARLAKDQISQQLYDEYAIRLQYMKSKAAGEIGLSLTEMLPAEAMKMRTTRTKLGRISEALGTGRFAVLAAEEKVGTAAAADAMSLLTYLEQGPIGAKHVKASEIGGFLSSMDDLVTAMHKNDPSEITRLSRSIIGQNPMGQAALEGGFTHARWGPGMTEPIFENIRGTNIERAAMTISESLTYANDPGVSGISALRERQIFRERGRVPSGREVETLLQSPTSFPFGHARDSKISRDQMEVIASRLSSEGAREYVMPPGSPGRGASESKAFLSEANRVAASGRGMTLAKKVGLGIGGSLLLAGILSRPAPSIGPAKMAPPQPRLTGSSGGAYMKPEDLAPPHRPVEAPSIGTFEGTGHSARIMPNRGNRYAIRASSPNSFNHNEFSRNLGRMMGGSSVVNTNLRDNRMRLNAGRLNELMEKE